jgi:hypothetical protein
MDTSPDEGDHEASIESRRKFPADHKTAFVVVVAPEKWHDERIQALLVESLKNEGIPHAIVKDSKMVEAQKSLEKEIEKRKTEFEDKIENLIVVVIADGYYHDDGEIIEFEDCYILLDTFIHPFIAIEENERQCKKTVVYLSKSPFRQKLHTDELPLSKILYT